MNEFYNVEFTTARLSCKVTVLKGSREDHITPLALDVKVDEGEGYLRILLGTPPSSPLMDMIKQVLDAACLAAYALYKSEHPGSYAQCPELDKEKVDSFDKLVSALRDSSEALSLIHSVRIEGDTMVFSFNEQT